MGDFHGEEARWAATNRVCKAWLDMREQLGPVLAQAFQDGFMLGERYAQRHPPSHDYADDPRAHIWNLGYAVGLYAGKGA